jgi:hypothetical protein
MTAAFHVVINKWIYNSYSYALMSLYHVNTIPVQEFGDKSSDLRSVFRLYFYPPFCTLLLDLKLILIHYCCGFEGLRWSKFGFGLSSKSCFVTTKGRPGVRYDFVCSNTFLCFANLQMCITCSLSRIQPGYLV